MRNSKMELVTHAITNTMTEYPKKKSRGTEAKSETEYSQLLKQLKKMAELDRAKSRFFADISNEFRTPLSMILGPLEQILAEKPGEELAARVKMMLRNAKRMVNLVEQILELSRVDSGNMTLKVVELDIIDFLNRIVMCFQSLSGQMETNLNFQAPDGTIPLYFDPEKLERIILNLLTNAFNFTPSGGNIQVSIWNVNATAYPPGYVEISVRDTGTGIPPDQLPHIFDRFFQGQDPPEYNRKDSFIGLALTKELVKLHHGDIEVRSNYRSGSKRGTEFIIRLPLGQAHFDPGEILDSREYESIIDHEFLLKEVLTGEKETGIETYKSDIQPDKGNRPIVLIVEDNADVRRYVRSILEPQFHVKEAADGKEGLSKAGEIMPHLIICDIMMPEIDGYQVCSLIKEDIETSHIPVILLTARASENNILRGLECQADDYITKPFSPRILTGRVKNLILQRQKLQKKFRDDILRIPGEIDLTSLDRKFMAELLSKVEENLSDPDFRVMHLANKLYISPSGLYKKVEALTGQSPQQLIRSYRLARAAQLLKAKSGNVTEIAFAVGFSNASYFTKCFKEQFGKIPSHW